MLLVYPLASVVVAATAVVAVAAAAAVLAVVAVVIILSNECIPFLKEEEQAKQMVRARFEHDYSCQPPRGRRSVFRKSDLCFK